jgi:iron complex outermembrane receptor protein
MTRFSRGRWRLRFPIPRIGELFTVRDPLNGRACEGVVMTLKALGLKRARRAAQVAVAGFVICGFGDDADAQQTQRLPDIYVTSSRLGEGITGASTTVIGKEEIERNPGESVQDLLAREAGIQTRSLYNGVAGAGTTVDLRGFGATAESNTLILLNGRRLKDIDMTGVDFTSIPTNSIERIEITRGNSGAVLYGDNAVGGVINIVTKAGVGLPPSLRVEGGFGSFSQWEGRVSASGSSGPWTSSIYGNVIGSKGYRDNNVLRQQNGVGEIRYTGAEGSAFLNLSGDNQHLGLPGERVVTNTSSELATNRRGTTSPFDYGDKQGLSATAGFTRMLSQTVELIVDGGVRHKAQQAFFAGETGDPFNYNDTKVTTYSITPRMKIGGDVFGLPAQATTGVDYYYAVYGSDRSQFMGAPPVHRFDLTQQSVGGYWQQTVAVLPSTDVSYGARLQSTNVKARDRVDTTAPGYFGDAEGLPLDKTELQHALHAGFEHRFNPMLAVFGRAARSFRTANVDERVGMAPFGTPTSFDLKTQTSRDIEGGVKLKLDRFTWQTSVYKMWLNDELYFDPVNFINYNLDPTQRVGVENIATLQVTDTVRLRGNLAYIRATFREGPNAGNDVPLVSRWTASLAASWDIVPKKLVFDGVVRYFSSRRMENDAPNTQPIIPPNTVVDVRLGGEIDHFFWSVAVQNVFDVLYFDYATASAFTAGRYFAYPLPGRTYMVRAGVQW